MSAEPTPFSLGFDALLTFLQRNDRTRKRPASFRGFLIYPEESLQLHRYRVVFADEGNEHAAAFVCQYGAGSFYLSLDLLATRSVQLPPSYPYLHTLLSDITSRIVLDRSTVAGIAYNTQRKLDLAAHSRVWRQVPVYRNG